MKLQFCFLLFLCLIFQALAQDKLMKNTALKPGDAVPDVLITNLSNYRIGNKPLTETKLSAFRGKLLILDFWATWCAPCRAMAPIMDSLQKTFSNQIQFLSVTYQDEQTIRPILNAMKRQKPFDLPEVTSDKTLHQLFPHQSLPHYVWISPQGIVAAITGMDDVNGANIKKVLAGKTLNTIKADVQTSYDPKLPLLTAGNGGGAEALKYHSLLTGYLPGLTSGMRITPEDSIKGQQFTLRNLPLIWFCRLAYAENGRWFPDAQIRLLTRDSARFNTLLTGTACENWLKDNGYCYELLVQPGTGSRAFTMIREDFRRLFPKYLLTLEADSVSTLALVRTSAIDKLKTAGGKPEVVVGPYSAHLTNSHLSQLVMRLQKQYLQGAKYPVVDRTGYTERADLRIDANLSDVNALNVALKPYGLALVIRKEPTEILVVRDKQTSLIN